jgi:membrane dipeptidase
MAIKLFILHILIISLNLLNCSSGDEKYLRQKAEKLSEEILIIDTHIDLPNELFKKYYDAANTNTAGQFDYQKGIKGKLNAAFMSIYIPSSLEEGGAKERADSLIRIVENLAEDNPDKFILAKSTADVKSQFSKSRISLAMGMENGSPIEGKLGNLSYFYNKGIRYITLCHSSNNHICDSSGDEKEKWNGLSPFGEKIIAEMNKLGIMVDISHVSDSTFYDVIKLSKTPVIASHSGCRSLSGGYPRNMSDEMIKLLAEKGGVVQIYFGPTLLNNELRIAYEERAKLRDKYLKDNDHISRKDAGKKFNEENPISKGSISDILKHINHVVKIAGIDHVGIGSDFDGISILPDELSDASEYPNLIYELLKTGYSEDDIKKICSGNILRVWSEAEEFAASYHSKEK